MRAVSRVSAVAAAVAVAAGAVYVWHALATPSAPRPGEIERTFSERAARVARAWEASDDARAWRQGLVLLSDLTRLPYAADIDFDDSVCFIHNLDDLSRYR